MADAPTRKPIQLTEEQKQTLIRMEGDIAWLKAELDKAKRAGISDPDQEKRFEDLVNKRRGILAEYS